MRDLVARWNAGERQRKRGWRRDDVPDYPGSAAYVRPRLSAALDVDCTPIRGELLTSAVHFLRARHQIRMSPFDLLRDPLLVGQLRPVAADDDVAWTPREVARLARLRRRYDRPQRI